MGLICGEVVVAVFAYWDIDEAGVELTEVLMHSERHSLGATRYIDDILHAARELLRTQGV